MKNLIGMTVVAFAFLLVSAAEPAQAQVGCCGGVGYGSFGQLGSPYALGRIDVPPYFALHPPVYYSQPVARTYGHSPFAYPGSHVTPEAPAPAPKAAMISNPHVSPVKGEKKPKLDLNLTQLEVINPFVKRMATKMVSFE